MVNEFIFILGVLSGLALSLGTLVLYPRYVLPLLAKPALGTKLSAELSTFPVPADFAQSLMPAQSPSGVYLPEEIMEYCEQESDEWAKEDCRQAAAMEYAKTKSWDMALQDLARANGELF